MRRGGLCTVQNLGEIVCNKQCDFTGKCQITNSDPSAYNPSLKG